MFDLRDLYALPIAFSLTVWDAVPIYVSIGLAMAIFARVVLNQCAFRAVWTIRDVASVEGIVYLAIFQPSLVPTLLITVFASIAIRSRMATDTDAPASPLTALRIRFGELVGPLLTASATAAVIKVFAPSIPDGLFIQTSLAMCGSILIPGRLGTSAIPAVAVSVHLGGFIPATAWLAGAAGKIAFNHFRETDRANAMTQSSDVESPR